jgi:hypothetical protein
MAKKQFNKSSGKLADRRAGTDIGSEFFETVRLRKNGSSVSYRPEEIREVKDSPRGKGCFITFRDGSKRLFKGENENSVRLSIHYAEAKAAENRQQFEALSASYAADYANEWAQAERTQFIMRNS